MPDEGQIEPSPISPLVVSLPLCLVYSKMRQDICISLSSMQICQHLEIRNQDTFIIAVTPPPPPATDQRWRRRKIEADRLYTALCTEIHEPIIHIVQINKGNFYFFSICRKKTCIKILICVFKNYFTNRNIYQMKILKIRTSQFLEVLKVKNWDCPVKSGRLAGMSMETVQLEKSTII